MLVLMIQIQPHSIHKTFFFHSPYGVFWWERCFISLYFASHSLTYLKKHQENVVACSSSAECRAFLWVYSSCTKDMWIFVLNCFKTEPLHSYLCLWFMLGFFSPSFLKTNYWLFGPCFSRPWSQKILCFKKASVPFRIFPPKIHSKMGQFWKEE